MVLRLRCGAFRIPTDSYVPGHVCTYIYNHRSKLVKWLKSQDQHQELKGHYLINMKVKYSVGSIEPTSGTQWVQKVSETLPILVCNLLLGHFFRFTVGTNLFVMDRDGSVSIVNLKHDKTWHKKRLRTIEAEVTETVWTDNTYRRWVLSNIKFCILSSHDPLRERGIGSSLLPNSHLTFSKTWQYMLNYEQE